MDILSNKEMVAREKEVFRSGLTAAALMEAAGEAMAYRISALYPNAREFLVLVGKGNNGGDGLVVARHLATTGRFIRVALTAAEDQLGELPQSMLERLRTGGHAEVVEGADDLEFPGSDGVVIDALLGIQAKGVLRGNLAGVVAKLNAMRARNFFRTVALDFPSGLAGFELGKPESPDGAVISDVTIAVGFAKEVLCRETLADWVGRIEVVPWSDSSNESGSHRILEGHGLSGLLPRRNALSHKGDFGRLVIVAGSRGFTGAPVLCAQATQAMGAGLLSIVTRADVADIVAAQAPPEAMVSGWAPYKEAPQVVKNASVIVFGPGLGLDEQTVIMLRAVLAIGCPVLIDADGLNCLAQNPGLLDNINTPVLLTPHPGEMTRLLARKFQLDEREAVIRGFTDQYNVTVVLKGTRTLITAYKHPLFINTTGNSGLSTGGSGDTLSGIIGALLSQGISPIDTARLGVWLHGHAADLALTERGCEEGLTPTMLSAHLGAALVSLRSEAAAPIGLIERAKELMP